VLPYDRDLCARGAEVTVAAQACGRRIDCADAWIAATALLAGAPLIAHNRNDYLGVPGLTLVSHGPHLGGTRLRPGRSGAQRRRGQRGS
jgi:predicted nucleic acid-binding protein